MEWQLNIMLPEGWQQLNLLTQLGMRYYLIEVGNAEEKPADTVDQLEYDGRLAIKAKDLKGLETLKEWIGN